MSCSLVDGLTGIENDKDWCVTGDRGANVLLIQQVGFKT